MHRSTQIYEVHRIRILKPNPPKSDHTEPWEAILSYEELCGGTKVEDLLCG